MRHRDAWRPSRAAALAAQPCLSTAAARCVRGRKGKKETEEGDVAAYLQDPLASGTGAGEVLGG
jgi:hypothetical protein